jgi:GNAT superfamily N-acetyltransferase
VDVRNAAQQECDVNIIDLGDEHRGLFAACLEEWSDDVREAGDRRACWVSRCLAKGLRAKLAVDERGVVGGMIQYLPIEHSTVDGSELYFIPCIWVHGHKQGRGNFQGHGMGCALLEAAEADARMLGAKGLAAWGLWLPFWMKASWFKRHGYREADRQGIAVLLWKPFSDDAQPPRWYPKGKKLPVPGKVNVTAFVNGWCTGMNLAAERARRAAVDLGDKVTYCEVDTSEPGAIAKWGFSDALFVDGKEIRTGPPPSYERIRSIIAKRVRG